MEQRIRIDNKDCVIISRSAYLSLRALARQINQGVIVTGHVNTVPCPIPIAPEYRTLAKRALTRLGEI